MNKCKICGTSWNAPVNECPEQNTHQGTSDWKKEFLKKYPLLVVPHSDGGGFGKNENIDILAFIERVRVESIANERNYILETIELYNQKPSKGLEWLKWFLGRKAEPGATVAPTKNNI